MSTDNILSLLRSIFYIATSSKQPVPSTITHPQHYLAPFLSPSSHSAPSPTPHANTQGIYTSIDWYNSSNQGSSASYHSQSPALCPSSPQIVSSGCCAYDCCMQSLSTWGVMGYSLQLKVGVRKTWWRSYEWCWHCLSLGEGEYREIV